MKKQIQSESATLRQKAEELLNKGLKKSIAQLTGAETYKLLHELQVHQIELELQNDELIQAKEQALIASEKYIELYDFAPSGYFTLSPTGNIIGLNLTGAKMLGKDRLQIKNRLFQLFLSDNSKPLFLQFLGKVFSGNIKESCELALSVSVNGNKTSYVYLTGIVAVNGEQCFVSATNITERKQAESDLRTSNEFNQALLNTIPFGMNIVDESGNILYLSEGLKKYFGNEALGKKCWELYIDDKIQCIDCPLHAGIKTGLTETYETHGVLGGKIFEVSHTGMIFNGQKAMLKIFIDITERKQAEAALLKSESEFRMLAESMPQIVWITRPEGSNIYFNQHWVDYTGLTIEESYGAGWSKPFHPDDQQRAWDAWQNATSNLATYSLECRLRRFDGEYKWWLIRGVPELDEHGAVVKWFGTCTDIDEIKLAAKELIKAKEHAEESDQLKSAFLANMSHEIRTPLNSIIGFSDLLNDPDFDQEQKTQFTRTIIENGNNLMVIINDILDLSMIAAGQMKFRKDFFSIQKLLEDLDNDFKMKASVKGIDLRLSFLSDGQELIIENDNYRIKQILTNLIGNAIKFTSYGSVEFGYLIKGENIEFQVKDTGIGIAREHFEAIFDRFRQLEITKTRRYGGNGLGLAISKNLAELLGGKMWVESEVGKGSTFHLSIPIHSKSNENNVSPHKIEISVKEIQIRNLKILIAEDEDDSSKLISIGVRKYASEIITVQNGTEAVHACRNNPDIDLVLMDIQMPEMDGYEATRQIRQFNKDVIIVAQTAFALNGDRGKALESGCNDYVSKPIRRDELMKMIQKYF